MYPAAFLVALSRPNCALIGTVNKLAHFGLEVSEVGYAFLYGKHSLLESGQPLARYHLRLTPIPPGGAAVMTAVLDVVLVPGVVVRLITGPTEGMIENR